jgi:hypothetical protein
MSHNSLNRNLEAMGCTGAIAPFTQLTHDVTFLQKSN